MTFKTFDQSDEGTWPDPIKQGKHSARKPPKLIILLNCKTSLQAPRCASWKVHKLRRSQAQKFTSWEDHKLRSSQASKLTSWQIEELPDWQNGKRAEWRDVKMTIWHVDRMTKVTKLCQRYQNRQKKVGKHCQTLPNVAKWCQQVSKVVNNKNQNIATSCQKMPIVSKC